MEKERKKKTKKLQKSLILKSKHGDRLDSIVLPSGLSTDKMRERRIKYVNEALKRSNSEWAKNYWNFVMKAIKHDPR